MDRMATQAEQTGLSQARAVRLLLGAAALVIALLSGALWAGLIWLLDSLF